MHKIFWNILELVLVLWYEQSKGLVASLEEFGTPLVDREWDGGHRREIRLIL